MRENEYQAKLIKKLKKMFPGCVVQKNDPNYLQGYPDLTIFFRDRWAALEVKISADSPTQPNQPFYVTQLNAMSFAAFIYPENELEVLGELQRTLTSDRQTRIPQSE